MRVGYLQIRLMRTTKETFSLSEFLVAGSALGLDISKSCWVGNGRLDVNNTLGFPTDILKDMNELLRDSSVFVNTFPVVTHVFFLIRQIGSRSGRSAMYDRF
jgi:hypothetical protein